MTSEFTSLIMDIKRQLHHNQERIITQTVIANITSLQNEPTLWNPWNEWILLNQTSTKLSIGASSTSININHIHTIRPHHMEHHISTITSHKWLPPTTSLHILWTSHLKMTPSIFNCFPSFNKSSNKIASLKIEQFNICWITTERYLTNLNNYETF